MTVATDYSPTTYTGDGTTSSLSTVFPFFGTGSGSELEIVSRVIATLAETVLTYGTHYTVAGGSGAVGTVTVVDPATDFPSTVQWVIRRRTNVLQNEALPSSGDLPTETIEDMFDRLTMIAQEQIEPLPRGYIDGLEVQNNATDADHDLDIHPGACRDVDDSVGIVLSQTLTKRADAAWAAGTGNGAMANGVTLGNDAEYYVFAIRNPTTGVVDGIIDTSAVGANIAAAASGFSQRRLIATRFTDGVANWIPMVQWGDWNEFATPIEDEDTTFPSTAAVTVSLDFVPSAYSVQVLLMGSTTAGVTVYISPLDTTDEAPGANPAIGTFFAATAARTNSFPPIRTNAAGQIRARSNGAGALFVLSVIGWLDERGKNA